MTDHTHGGQVVQDGGFNRFTWMLLAAFGSLLLIISCAALSKLWAVSDRVADQAGDIKVILTNQAYGAQNTVALAADVKELRTRLADIERRQLEGRNAIR